MGLHMKVGKTEPVPCPWALDTLSHNKRANVLKCPRVLPAAGYSRLREFTNQLWYFWCFWKLRWIFPSRNCCKWLFVEVTRTPLACCLPYPRTPSGQEELSQHCFALEASSSCLNLLILAKLYVGEIPGSSHSCILILLGAFDPVLAPQL